MRTSHGVGKDEFGEQRDACAALETPGLVQGQNMTNSSNSSISLGWCEPGEGTHHPATSLRWELKAARSGASAWMSLSLIPATQRESLPGGRSISSIAKLSVSLELETL